MAKNYFGIGSLYRYLCQPPMSKIFTIYFKKWSCVLRGEIYAMHVKQGKDIMNKPYVPIYEKVALTIEEAAEYSNIGQNRISNLLKEPRCPFVLYVGAKKLVKRKEFERFILENIEI